MNSWKLLLHTVIFWEAFENPVFLREIDHPPVWYGVFRRLVRAQAILLAMLVGASLIWIVLLFLLNNLLALLVPPVLASMLLVSLTIAPIVSEERAKKSWEPLLVMPDGAEAVLLGKVGGAMWWLRHLITAMGILLVLVSMGVGFVSLVLIPTTIGHSVGMPVFMLCGLVVVLPVGGCIVFVIDRVQQFLLIMVAAITISTSTTTVRGALSASGAATFFAWLLDVGVAVLVLALVPGQSALLADTNWLALATMGPLVGYITELDLGQVALLVSVTFLVRESVLRLLWRVSVWQARRL